MDWINYLERIKVRLGALEEPRRVAFCVWCSNRLQADFEPYLSQRMGNELAPIREALGQVWTSVIGGEGPSREAVETARDKCLEADWDQEDVPEQDQQRNSGAIELLGCIRRTLDCWLTGDSRFCSEAAERVVNCIDYELNMVMGVRDTFAHPMMRAELDRQERFLLLLERRERVLSPELLELF